MIDKRIAVPILCQLNVKFKNAHGYIYISALIYAYPVATGEESWNIRMDEDRCFVSRINTSIIIALRNSDNK